MADPVSAAFVPLAGGAVLGFLVGSVNPAIIVARVLGKDLRGSGSGNPGATNAGRVLGLRWGLLVGVLDVLKALLPVLAAARVAGALVAYVVGVAAVLGHVWSPFLRGRGGKGVATAFGAILGVHWQIALAALGLFLVGALAFRRIGAGSVMAGASLLVLGGLMLARVVPSPVGLPFTTSLWLLVLAVVILGRHHRNVRGWVRREASGG